MLRPEPSRRPRSRTPRRTARRTRGTALALTTALAAGLLAGCTSSSGNAGAGGDLGFVPGDGSIKTWDAGDRGKPVDLAGTAFDGTKVDTSAWRGDVVVVNTWYASCAPCRKEAPDLVALAGTEPAGVKFVGINSTDDAGAALAFQRTFDVPYPSIADKDGSVIATLQGVVPVQAVPTTVVLDTQGRVAARVLGATTKATLQGLVDDVRAEGTSAS